MKVLCGLVLASWFCVLSGSAWGQAAPVEGMSHARGAVSTGLVVSVGGKAITLGAAELAAVPAKTVTVHNTHRNVDETYTGVALTDVLAKAGPGASGKPLLRSYVRAEGTDKYWVLYSGIEIEAASHMGDVIVATMLDGKPLGESGAFMLVSTEDKKPQRWVRNLAALTLIQLPAAQLPE